MKSGVALPRVLATRPDAQNPAWCSLLQQAGFATLAIPVLGIEPVREPRQRQAIKNLILNFDQFDKVILVSQNAVRELLTWLDRYWPQLPEHIHYFAVGETTGRLLQDAGIAAVSCQSAMDSDELLALPPLQQVEGQKILIGRGRGGRPRLGQELQARGARVSYGEFYQRTLPSNAFAALRNSDFLKSDYREILSAFSGESLVNLVEVLKTSGRQEWQQLPLLVPGERVAAQARAYYFEQIIAAANATDAAMLAALQDWHGSRDLQ